MKKPLFSLAIFLSGLMAFSHAAEPATKSPEILDLEQHRGKVVVLDFWASWCVPCRRSFPWLNEMHARYEKDGLIIIGVNVDQERAEALAFLDTYPAQFIIHYDPSGHLAEEFEVRGMPTSFIIGRDGQLAAQHLGFKVKRQNEYEAAIAAALQQENTR